MNRFKVRKEERRVVARQGEQMMDQGQQKKRMSLREGWRWMEKWKLHLHKIEMPFHTMVYLGCKARTHPIKPRNEMQTKRNTSALPRVCPA